MVKHLVALIFVTAFLTFFVMMVSCSDPILPLIKSKYPGCEILKYEELGKGYVEAHLQCGPLIKVVRFQDRRN